MSDLSMVQALEQGHRVSVLLADGSQREVKTLEELEKNANAFAGAVFAGSHEHETFSGPKPPPVSYFQVKAEP